MWFVIFCVFIFTLSWYLYNVYGYWRRRGIPYATPFPFLGSLPLMLLQLTTPIKAISKIYYQFPDEKFFGCYMILSKAIMVKDPELLKQITVKHFDHFIDHTPLFITEDTDPILSKNLFSSHGKKWKSLRSILSPAFTSSKMKMMFHLVSQCGEQTVDELLRLSKENTSSKDPTTLNYEMKDLFSRFTNDVIATCAFGLKCDSLKDKNNEFFQMGKKIAEINNVRMLLVAFLPKLTKSLGEGFLSGKVVKFFRNLIVETIAHREKEGIIRPDMIHLLMEAKKGNLKHEKEDHDTGFATVQESEIDLKKKTDLVLTDDDIVGQALIFFIAGFDTSSMIMSFVAHELAMNLDIQKRLQQEIDDSLITNEGKVTYESLFKMEYLDMVISECLRKWPPLIAIERICRKDFELITEKRSVVIEAGVSTMFPLYNIHHDAKYYQDPEKFDPERFNSENKYKIQPFTYFPFGLGPRACIGNRFALMEIKIILFYLLRKFDFIVTEKTDTKLELLKHISKITAKNGFWIGLKPRKRVE